MNYGQQLQYKHFLTRETLTGTYTETHTMTGEYHIRTTSGAHIWVHPNDTTLLP